MVKLTSLEDVPDDDCLVEEYEGETSAKNNPNTMNSKGNKVQTASLLIQAFP